MSARIVEEEVKRFLADPTPEVLCIMGHWGVGKTYAWNQYLNAAITDKTIALKRYSYVSLFGQNSLEGIKYTIFENTLPIENLQEGATFESLSKTVGFLQKQWRKVIGFAGRLPQAESYLPAIARGLFLTVQKQIVCIDDLERTGESLSIQDVMGLVSFLKEQRKCKIVLLLNNEELGDQKKVFDTQLEKVSDVEIHFEPTPQEAADIGLDKNLVFYESLAKASIALGIVNIRVIRKVQRLIRRLEELLKTHDKRILEAAIPSLVIFGWAVYQPKQSPNLDFIKNFNPYKHLLLEDKEKESEEDKKWRLTISATGFSHFDEFDEVLLNSVEAGYFDAEKIDKAATAFDKRLKAQDQDNSFSAAWQKYHGSFDCNQNEILDEMYAAVMKGSKAISPSNFDSALGFFRKFGRDAEAEKMIKHYMEERSDEGRDFFDPDRSVFLRTIDSALKKAFEDKLASYKDVRTPEDILSHIAQHSGWNPEDIATLASLFVDDYYALFKRLNGDKLRISVSQALKFGKYDISSSNPEMIRISSNATEALNRIASECELNKMRVKSYGITLKGEDSQEEE